MEFDDLRTYCLAKKGVEETLPFDNNTLVFKVMGKMFALISISEAKSVNLKCNPEKAEEMRAQWPDDVFPGYHMNKKHWNTVNITGRLSDKEIQSQIDDSYNLIVQGLPKKDREKLMDL